MSEDNINILIITMYGKFTWFNISRKTKIKTLKELIHHKLDIAVNLQVLIYGNKLENDLTLEDYNVKNDNAITLILLKRSENICI